MRLSKMQGFLSLAVVCLAAGRLLANDYVASVTPFGGVDLASTPSSSLSNQSIDRLVDLNSSYDSVAPSYARSVVDEETAAPASNASADVFAPATSDVQPKQLSSAAYVLGGCFAVFGVGLGLCCLGLMSGRQRTINTFTAGFVRVK